MFDINDIIKPSGIFLVVKDMNLKFSYCNENFAEALGLDSPSQIVGKSDYDFFDYQTAEFYRAGDGHVLNGGTYVNVLEKQQRQNHEYENIVTKAQLKNQSNVIVGVINSFISSSNFALPQKNGLLNYNAEKSRYEFYIGNQIEYFTKAQYSVLNYAMLGYSAKQIAQKLNISPRTAEEYLNAIKKKLQCNSKFRIAETALRLGIMQQPSV